MMVSVPIIQLPKHFPFHLSSFPNTLYFYSISGQSSGVSLVRLCVPQDVFLTDTCTCDDVALMLFPHLANLTVSSAAQPGFQLHAFQRLSRL